MEIKIYYGNKVLYLCDQMNENLKELLHHPDVVYIDELSSRATNSMLHEIKKNDFHAGIMCNQEFEKLRKNFFKHFIVIEAAGGIVQNEEHDILFIFRRGKWDLPKGKIEKDELPVICAEREIGEETAARNLSLVKPAGDSFHIYDEFGKHFLKINHWFHFTCSGKQELLPQVEEDISEIKWFRIKELRKPLSNTYPAIKELIERFLKN